MDTDPTIILLCLAEYQKQEIPVQQNKNYLRLLGFTDAGRRFLKEKEISIYSRIGKRGTRSGTVS